jgi:LCP family protein required for cell wall assembly
MNSSTRRTWWVLGGFLLVALALLAIILYPEVKKRWITPLGPGLGLPGSAPALSSARDSLPDPSDLAGRNNDSTGAESGLQSLDDETINATTKLAETPQPHCGGPPSMTILVVGSDSRSGYLYGLADVIRIVSVDFVSPQVNVFSLPRDLWVEIPDIGDNLGITHGKLNQAYFYGTPGMGYYEGPAGGAGLLARTLELNYGLHVDHYGVVNLETFVKIVDAMGGIDIDLPTEVDGRPFEGNDIDMGYFPAGQQHLNGEQTMRLVRIRQKYNDFIRMDNQTRVICALKEKIATPAILPKIPQMIASLRNSVLTDLTPQQLAQLACLAPQLEPENLLFTGLPQEIMSSGQVYSPQLKDETFVLDADSQVIQNYAGQFMTGSGSIETNETACP